MMEYSERSEYVGANVRPEVKKSLQDHIQDLRDKGERTSVSKWIDEAIRERLAREGVKITPLEPDVLSEPLPFEESVQ
jgi:hypothetical protein